MKMSFFALRKQEHPGVAVLFCRFNFLDTLGSTPLAKDANTLRDGGQIASHFSTAVQRGSRCAMRGRECAAAMPPYIHYAADKGTPPGTRRPANLRHVGD